MTRDKFEQITNCLHLTNAPESATNKSSPSYDKLHKIRWMLDEVREWFICMWAPNQQLTVDESMIMYKRTYCPIRLYMPCKPIHFGLKVWAATNALSKYLWNFEIYCEKHGNPHDDDNLSESTNEDMSGGEFGVLRSGKGEGFQGHNVVMQLLKDLVGKGHIVTIDNFFTSVPLFLDLLENGIMATGTLRENRKYVPCAMFSKKITKKQDIGWIDYRMHEEKKRCCMVLKDKQLVVFLSTHAEPISTCGPKPFVWRKIGGKKKKLRTRPIHLQYTREPRFN
jgi:hypothetical protein